MKSTVLTLVVVLVLGLLGISGWYMTEKSRISGESEAFAEEAGARELVTVSFVVEVPESTPADQTVFISGSHPELGAWQAAGMPLRRGEDGMYHGKAELLTGIEHEFKITRGTWSTVELDAEDQPLDNRPLVVEGEMTVEAKVASWVDKGQSVPSRITLSGDLRMHPKVASELLELPRDLVVYLPPGYDDAANAQTRYPVLYLNDGQNLFNESTSYAGIEWGVDEALQEMIPAGEVPPMIVVGIYNTEDRDEEYTPGQQVDAYSKLVTTELKPMIDRLYRTQAGREATSIGGSSLGGLAAIVVAQQNPGMFGRVVALSPTLHVGGDTAANIMGSGLTALSDTAFYFDMGDGETDNYPEAGDAVSDAEAFAAALNAAGVVHTYTVVEGGEHHEDDWADRIGDVLGAVFGGE
ncbi:MAG: alpha/beta hydrolase-fold protein [Planctomycetota bacterium]